VFESGIANAPNFADNYFWAAKLMKASSNPLWTWIYAELFVNISDNDEMIRTASELAATAKQKSLLRYMESRPRKNGSGTTISAFEGMPKQPDRNG
jgi:hypothetical protein